MCRRKFSQDDERGTDGASEPLLCLRSECSSSYPKCPGRRRRKKNGGGGREGDFSSIFGELPQSFIVASALRAIAQAYTS